MHKEMDAQYFIDKFEAIPENRWCVGNYVKVYVGETHRRHCAHGHCFGIKNELEGLLQIIHNAADINDGEDGCYQQATPKQRILAALYGAKERGL
jgi:hypothetical protein